MSEDFTIDCKVRPSPDWRSLRIVFRDGKLSIFIDGEFQCSSDAGPQDEPARGE